MPESKLWWKAPNGEGYYWADDGIAITMVYVAWRDGRWVAYNPLASDQYIPLSRFVKWSWPLIAPPPDEE